MTIYLAGPWARRDEVKEVRAQLQSAGFVVKSRWLDVDHVDSKAYGDATDDVPALQEEALRDLEDIDDADIMVVSNLQLSEGKAVEQGIALATSMPIIVIGERLNVFQYLDHVTVVPDVESAIRALAEFEREFYADAA